MTAPRVLRPGPWSHRVWPFLLGAAILGGATALVPAEGGPGRGRFLLLAAAAGIAAAGVVRWRRPLVTLEKDRFVLHEVRRPDAPPPVPINWMLPGSTGGVRGIQSSEGSHASHAPPDLPWDGPVPRDLVTGASGRNGLLVVTLRGRKGRSIPLQGLPAGDRRALLAWFRMGVEEAGVEAGLS